jgi:alanine-glyoxylate transaminase/serine-glyoxylate transaminase/serine-pyruvate transaminase
LLHVLTREAQVPEIEKYSANGMTAIYYPESIASPTTEFLPKVMGKVAVAGGLHAELAPKYFRVGHMGLSAVDSGRHHIETTLEAIRVALQECDYKFTS